MTSIQLPPLQFDDGGFRVSIITGHSPSAAPDANPFADPTPETDPAPSSDSISQQSVSPAPERTSETSVESRQLIDSPRKSHDQPPADVPEDDKAEPDAEPDLRHRHRESGDDAEVAFKLDPAIVPESDSYPPPRMGSIPPSKGEMRLPFVSENEEEPRPEPDVVFRLDVDPADDAEDGHDDAHDVEEAPVAAKPPQSPVVPSHPIETLRRAFAESLEEATSGKNDKPALRELDAKGRRDRLLEQAKDETPADALWRYRPGQSEHEVLKLIAQISFGVYLLLNGMANDNAQVVSILQGHINEVDEFLEVTLEDLSQASADLTERLDYLRLPMSNMKVFEEMLEDRNYRAEILDGNEKIDKVLARMHVIMKQWDDDVDAGLRGTTAFMGWLNSVRDGPWRHERPDLVDIFEAMKGNTEGWLGAFDDMNSKTQSINTLIINLMTVVAEMEKKAGEISRKTWSTIPPYSSPASASLRSRRDNSSTSSPRSYQSHARSMTRDSVRSGGTISTGPHSQIDEMLDSGIGDSSPPAAASTQFPVPPRAPGRMHPRKQSGDAPRLRVETAAPIPSPVHEATTEEENESSPLYTLQPKTYTPRTPQPSPLIKGPPSSPPSPGPRYQQSEASTHMRPPTQASSIRMPAASPNHERTGSRGSAGVNGARQSGGSRIMIRESSSSNLQVRDSTTSGFGGFRDSSGSEVSSFSQHRVPRVASHMDLRQARPSMAPTANSDYQHYHPVLASPHSPLQQRPHTAAGPHARQPSNSSYYLQAGPRQPSRLGSMATLSTVGSETKTVTPSTRSAGGKTLKKKRSAFGWLKKAFTMDDEEKAAFEARKALQYPDNYYKDKDPKFLDGRRVR